MEILKAQAYEDENNLESQLDLTEWMEICKHKKKWENLIQYNMEKQFLRRNKSKIWQKVYKNVRIVNKNTKLEYYFQTNKHKKEDYMNMQNNPEEVYTERERNKKKRKKNVIIEKIRLINQPERNLKMTSKPPRLGQDKHIHVESTET